MLLTAAAFLTLVMTAAAVLNLENSSWFVNIIFWLGAVLNGLLAWINIRKQRFVLGGVCAAAALVCAAVNILQALAH